MNYAEAASTTSTPTREETSAPTTRPRTLFLTTTEDLDFPRLFDILKTDSTTCNYVDHITGLFEGRKENFKKDRLPDYLMIDGKSCKTYLPRELYVPTCGRCLKPGHNFIECESEPVCRYCKEMGHILKDCPSKRNDFPTTSGYTWTIPKRRRMQTTNPHYSELQTNIIRNASQPAATSNNSTELPNDVQPTVELQNDPLPNMELQNGAQPNMDIRELQSTVNQNVLQPATTPENCSHNATTNNKQGNSMPESDFVSKVHEFSSSSNSDDLKEISNWSECEDAGSVLSPLSTPPNLPLPKQTRQSSRLKQTSTIGNTPFHPPSKSNPYVRVMVRNIQAPDISTSSVFSTTPEETSSAPAVLEYTKSKSNTVDLNESNLDNSDYANKRSREETSSDSSFSTTLEFRLVGKKKK